MQVILKQVLRTLAVALWLIVHCRLFDPTTCRRSDSPCQNINQNSQGYSLWTKKT